MFRQELIHTAMVFGPSLLFVLVFPPLMGMAIVVGQRRREAQRRRMEAYRASPESHLLNLR